MEHPVSLADELMEEEEVCPECGHVHEHGEHHHHDHDERMWMHDHDHDHEEHEHHHHDHDEECGCGHDHDHEEHEHHHHHDHDDHDETAACGCHDHHDIITIIMQMKYLQAGVVRQLRNIQKKILRRCWKLCLHADEYGIILRAKGMLPAEDGTWIYFDMVPEETEIRDRRTGIYRSSLRDRI